MSVPQPTDVFRRFAQNRLFDGIEPHVLEEIRHEVKTRRVEAGEVIFEEGDAGDSLYLVGDGSVKISKTGRGGAQETLGNFFGEMALLDGQPRSAKATAAKPTLLASVDEPTFQHILALAPSRLHMNFLRSVTQRLRDVNSHFITEVMRNERLSLVGSMANSILHDLKNPICIVRCCADLLNNEKENSTTQQLAKMLTKAADGMLSMTQELLDYARGDTSLKKTDCSVWHLLDQLNEQALQLLPGQNVRLIKHVRYEGNLEIDVPRFVRVISNLIKNAREAMASGGILTLDIERDGEQAVLRVADTGCGMSPEVLAQIFEPFFTHGKKNGTGLGMAIARSVIDAHGGQISVRSVQGSGTTVEVRVPIPQSRPDTPSEDAHSS
jgi:signal transduction histidine kinase